MIAVVRDARGVTHVAILLPDEEVDPGKGPVIGALCEHTISNIFSGSFTAWEADEIEEEQPDCMSCLVAHETHSGPIRSES